MESDDSFERATALAQEIFNRVRAFQRGERKGLALPPLTGQANQRAEGRPNRHDILVALAMEADLEREAATANVDPKASSITSSNTRETYKFGAGVMFSKSRKIWVPSFRVYSPRAPKGRSGRDGLRQWTGSEAIRKILDQAVSDLDRDVGIPYFTTISTPRYRSRPHAEKLNGRARKDLLFPGAGVSPTTQGPNSSFGYVAVRREDIQGLRNRLREVRVGDLTLNCLEFDDVGSGSPVFVVPRNMANDLVKLGVLSGHGATDRGRISESSTTAERLQFRVWDGAPSKDKYAAEYDDAIGHLVDARFPRLNVSSHLDLALVELNVQNHLLLPSHMTGAVDRTLAGVVMSPFNQIPHEDQPGRAGAKTHIPVTLRGLGSGVVTGEITCIRTQVTGYDHRGLPLSYDNMIEVIGTSHRIGRPADSGGPVVVEGPSYKDYLLGTVCLGAERAFELGGYLGVPASDRLSVAYVSAAHTQLEDMNIMLVVE